MRKFNCIVVEDEPLAAEVLCDYIRQVHFLDLKAVCADAIFAMEVLQREQIDLIFLDIHLPKLKGQAFIKSLKNPPQVIITTAYQEYALEGYELNVTDYLLKPIELSRFLTAVNKLRQLPAPQPPAPQPARMAAPERAYLFFNVAKKKVKVYLDEILYIESLKEYIGITTPRQTILTKFQLGEIEELLARNNFIRVHRSFIVAKDKIDAFTATDIEVGGKAIPIGRSYKELVLRELS